MFGGWGFKLSAGFKLSLPLSMQTGTVPAVANPNRFYLHLGNWPTDGLVYFTGGNPYCVQPHSFGAQMSAKVDLLFLNGIIAIYWSIERELLAERNLVTFDLILLCSLKCAAGKYLLPSATQCCGQSQSGSCAKIAGACTNCIAGTYSAAVGATVGTCTSCLGGKYSPTSCWK